MRQLLSLSLIYRFEMVLVNGRINKSIVHHIVDCLPMARLSVSIVTGNGISGGSSYRISDSRAV